MSVEDTPHQDPTRLQDVFGTMYPDELAAAVLAHFGCSSEAELVELIAIGKAVGDARFAQYLAWCAGPGRRYSTNWEPKGESWTTIPKDYDTRAAALRGSVLSVAPPTLTPTCETCAGCGDLWVHGYDTRQPCPDCVVVASEAPTDEFCASCGHPASNHRLTGCHPFATRDCTCSTFVARAGAVTVTPEPPK